ncbi:MAG: amidohydrolase [Nitrospinae bacterium]|nr:amidohydrolase [Nitrospinota bacterium]
MIIDFHCHVWMEEWLPEPFWQGIVDIFAHMLARHGMKLPKEEVRRQFFPAFWDPTAERLIASMDEAGIDRAVILPLDYGLTLGEPPVSIEEQNRIYAQLAQQHPGRLIAFASVDPRREGADRLFEVGVKEWGLRGLKLHPTVGYYPSEEACYPLYRKAAELGVPVISHTGPIIAPLKSKYAQPIHLDDALVDFPQVQFVAAHLSFCWWTELANLAGTKTNLAADISGWQLTARDHYPFFCQTLRSFLNSAGSDNLLYGTDNPAYRSLISDREWIQLIRDLPHKAPEGISFTEAEVEAILGGNARRILGLSER